MFRVIIGMSRDRQSALEKCRRYTATVTDHICKIIAFHDVRSDQVDHWIDEITEKVVKCSTYTVKPRNKRFRPEEYENTLFGFLGDSDIDAKDILEDCYEDHCIRDRYDPYPKFEITPKLVHITYLICQDIIKDMCKLLADTKGESADYNEVKSLFYRIFRKYLNI